MLLFGPLQIHLSEERYVSHHSKSLRPQTRSWRFLIVLATLLLFVALLAPAGATAQQSGDLGYRTVFTFHVWVDPIYGDDAQASVPSSFQAWPKNPTGKTVRGNKALSRHVGLDKPNATPPSPWPGRIVFAPFSFRTVTSAIAYVQAEFEVPATTTTPAKIWWTFDDDDTNGSYTVNRVVIHCLPGLYGAGTQIEPRTGLRYNGETFPIRIPSDVSIQGTSALDTVFDAQGAFVNVFQFNSGTKGTISHVHSFIDGVTIRGARSKEWNPAKPATIRIGAGVMIAEEGNMQPVISNCFITDNDVGIAVDAYPPFKEVGTPLKPWQWIHSPIIVNNTIAWNRIGIWNGQVKQYTGGAPGTVNKGFSRPRVLNNIIDSVDINNKFGNLTSAFEGLDPSDLRIDIPGSNPLVRVDFNAYELGRYNLTSGTNGNPLIAPPGWRAGWCITQPRTANPTYVPRRDITPWTRPSSGPRKSLYINETLTSYLGASSVENSLSPHDFRLTVHPEAGDPSLSPLTDLGIDLGLGVLKFQNYHAQHPTVSPIITYEPGLKSPGPQIQGYDSDYAALHAWDNDCEGFGNPRIHDRLDAPDQVGFTRYSYMDLGADEMGDLIMTGYIDRTRIFSEMTNMGGGGSPPFNLTAYFIGIANTNYPRPLYWQEAGRSVSVNLNQAQPVTGWWDYVQRLPGAVVPYPGPVPWSSYTIEGLDVAINPTVKSTRRSLTTATPLVYNHFMRNLECDFSPSLLPDMHPGWALVSSPSDAFAANPWYHHQAGPFKTWDNRDLYYLPSLGYAPVSGHINPPGTKEYDMQMGYLVGYGAQFGPYSGGGALHYNTNLWGLGDASGFDWVPSTNGAGVRMNCEVFPVEGPAGANLQTFLVVENSVVPLSATSTKTKAAPTTKFPASATLSQIRAARLKLRQRVIKSLKR